MTNMYTNGRSGTAEMEFEAPPYPNLELEDEWGMNESTNYSNSEFANEWEVQEATQYANPYSNPEFEDEWEVLEAMHSSNPEMESEWETEGEYFFKKALRGIKKIAQVAAPLAKRLAPIAAKTLVGAIPGVGATAGPLAGKLVSTLLREGEMEAVQMEAEFFGTNEAEAEVSNTQAAYEAALTEVLAAEASHSQSESEAEALLGAAVSSTLKSMSAQRPLRYIIPVLVQANARLVRLLHGQGSAGRQLLRLMPTVMRRTIASLKAARRAGQPINAALAQRLMAAQAARVFGDSKTLTKAMIRNAIIRQRTVAPSRSISRSA